MTNHLRKQLKQLKCWGALLLITFLPLLIAALIIVQSGKAAAQGSTPTAFQFSIPSKTPIPPNQITLTPSWTPTEGPISPIVAEAINPNANVRSSPSIEGSIVGKIQPGQFYAVIKRFEKWIQIDCPKVCKDSPDGRGWVFSDIVNIAGGNLNTIPLASAIPTANIETAAAQKTANYLTQTPGAAGSATALQASATGVYTLAPGAPTFTRSGPLAKFTIPPNFVEATLPAHAAAGSGRGGLPLIIPIIGLGVLGLAGVVVSILRRIGR